MIRWRCFFSSSVGIMYCAASVYSMVRAIILGVDHEQGASILLIIGVNCAVLNYTFPSLPLQES